DVAPGDGADGGEAKLPGELRPLRGRAVPAGPGGGGDRLCHRRGAAGDHLGGGLLRLRLVGGNPHHPAGQPLPRRTDGGGDGHSRQPGGRGQGVAGAEDRRRPRLLRGLRRWSGRRHHPPPGRGGDHPGRVAAAAQAPFDAGAERADRTGTGERRRLGDGTLLSMARLVVTSPGGAVRTVPLVKRITSVGRGSDVDVRLEDAGAPEHALTLLWDGRTYRAGSVGGPFYVGGKKREAHVLKDGDVLRVGDSWIALSLSEIAEAEAPVESQSEPLEVLQRLTEFSARLLQSTDVPSLL